MNITERNSEIAVISCLLTDLDCIEKIYGALEPDMFSNAILGKFYFELRKSYDSGEPVNMMAIIDSASTDDTSRQIATDLIAEALGHEALSVQVDYYAKSVLRQYKARVIERAIVETKISETNVEDVMARLSQTIDDLGGAIEDGTIDVSRAVDEYSKDMFQPNRQQGINLGYRKLDLILGGLDGGNMVIVAARPSVGKSAFVTEVAINMARSGRRVGVYSLEMPNKEVYERMIAHESGININRIRRATSFVGGEGRCFDEGNESLRKLPIVLVDDLHTVKKMHNSMKRHKIDVAVIDYAQLIRPENAYRGNRTAEVGQISHAVKWTAKNLNIPVILLAQLNRVSTQTESKEPTMSELRESGDFEQDADKIILLWNKDKERRVKGVKVDKNRQGLVGSVTMSFDGAVMHFVEVDDFKKIEADPPFGLDW